MAELKNCDRCKKNIDGENQIGVTIEIKNYTPKYAYIRPGKVLHKAIEADGTKLEYLPIEFKEGLFGEFDLCNTCFDDFMKIPTPTTPVRD